MTIFGQDYADIYDDLYEKKDYSAEVGPLVDLLTECEVPVTASLLDVGCGTGRHALELARRGYSVSGTDLSESMLNRARNRCGSNVHFLLAESIREQALTFDVTYSLFDVLSYQTSVEGLLGFLGDLAAWTNPGGFVIADSWHLPGVMSDPPRSRTARYVGAGGKIFTRTSEVSTNWVTGITDVAYQISIEGVTANESFEECHQMRAFTTLELDLALRLTGLELIEFFALPNLRESVSANDWHVGFIARKVS